MKGGGRCRRHSRSKSPSTNTLYIDVAGPFILAHGHDSGLKKHIVVFALRTSQDARTDPSGDEETTEQEEKEDVMGCTHQCERWDKVDDDFVQCGEVGDQVDGHVGVHSCATHQDRKDDGDKQDTPHKQYNVFRFGIPVAGRKRCC